MDKLNDEKYISIEYETWKTKYLPMEEENNELKRKLEDRVIEMRIRRDYGYDSYIRENFKINYSLDVGWDIKDVGRKVEDAIKDTCGMIEERAELARKLSIANQDLMKAYSNINNIPKWIRKIFNAL